ncbi:hypothetical protein [Patiriisocius sp. Uisw_017]|uniref:hypothetical protein n=1 Tax=Patiriisocius sp. Uisw_017 TaxID=3230968 RepID=UPI0039E95543
MKKTLRTIIILILFVTNSVFGQEKVMINEDCIKYEINDEFHRYDDVEKSQNDFKNLNLVIDKNTTLSIENSYNGGLMGYDINFNINSNLEIKNVTYDFWDDVIDLDNVITYEVCQANLSLNQNPFITLKELRGNYNLEIEKYCNGYIVEKTTYKGKFKTFKGLDPNSENYKWVTNKSIGLKNVKDPNGVYLSPENPPILISDSKLLIEELNKVNEFRGQKIKAFVVINENGMIEKEPIRFSIKLSSELESKLIMMLIKFTKWNPAVINGKTVKSSIPIVINTE